MKNEEYIKITKILNTDNIKGFQLEIHGLSTEECLIVAAQIVTQIEINATTENEKALIRTNFLQLLNDMRNSNANIKI